LFLRGFIPFNLQDVHVVLDEFAEDLRGVGQRKLYRE